MLNIKIKFKINILYTLYMSEAIKWYIRCDQSGVDYIRSIRLFTTSNWYINVYKPTPSVNTAEEPPLNSYSRMPPYDPIGVIPIPSGAVGYGGSPFGPVEYPSEYLPYLEMDGPEDPLHTCPDATGNISENYDCHYANGYGSTYYELDTRNLTSFAGFDLVEGFTDDIMYRSWSGTLHKDAGIYINEYGYIIAAQKITPSWGVGLHSGVWLWRLLHPGQDRLRTSDQSHGDDPQMQSTAPVDTRSIRDPELLKVSSSAIIQNNTLGRLAGGLGTFSLASEALNVSNDGKMFGYIQNGTPLTGGGLIGNDYIRDISPYAEWGKPGGKPFVGATFKTREGGGFMPNGEPKTCPRRPTGPPYSESTICKSPGYITDFTKERPPSHRFGGVSNFPGLGELAVHAIAGNNICPVVGRARAGMTAGMRIGACNNYPGCEWRDEEDPACVSENPIGEIFSIWSYETDMSNLPQPGDMLGVPLRHTGIVVGSDRVCCSGHEKLERMTITPFDIDGIQSNYDYNDCVSCPENEVKILTDSSNYKVIDACAGGNCNIDSSGVVQNSSEFASLLNHGMLPNPTQLAPGQITRFCPW